MLILCILFTLFFTFVPKPFRAPEERETIGEYISLKETLAVEIDRSGNEPALIVHIDPPQGCSDAYIRIEGKDDIKDYINASVILSELYNICYNQALENDDADIVRPFDVRFPPVRIGWEYGNRHLSARENHLQPYFIVTDDEFISLAFFGEVTEEKNELSWSQYIGNPDDMTGLVGILKKIIL